MTSHPKKILLIEDDLDLQRLYLEILTDEGFVVDTAEDGEAGLLKMKQGQYALVMLDIMMPKKDGLEILKEVKAATPKYNTPVIFITNMGYDSSVQKGLGLGAVAYLTKADYTPDQIVAEVRKYIK